MMSFRIISTLAEIDPINWDGLHGSNNPFVSHAFLSGLESSGCLRPEWGWTACHPTLWDGDRLLAAAPGYLKGNSHGEFVFDHAWAEAYSRYGRHYFPKWLIGIPYTPVTGPRLLAVNQLSRMHLLEAMKDFAISKSISSIHINFSESAESAALDAEWLARSTVQFHWHNKAWRDFDDFLSNLKSKKRKNIRQERTKTMNAGYCFRTLVGKEIEDDDLQTMHGFYQRTFEEYGNAPALTLAFFQLLREKLPEHLVLVMASRDGVSCAGALFLRSNETLYGRYWGSSESSPGLHFETCYYQGIEYCIREGLTCFEPGAQGEHKVARGFLPIMTHSRHWLSDRAFSKALAPWCASETKAMQEYAFAIQAEGPYNV